MKLNSGNEIRDVSRYLSLSCCISSWCKPTSSSPPVNGSPCSRPTRTRPDSVGCHPCVQNQILCLLIVPSLGHNRPQVRLSEENFVNFLFKVTLLPKKRLAAMIITTWVHCDLDVDHKDICMRISRVHTELISPPRIHQTRLIITEVSHCHPFYSVFILS